MKAWQYDKAGGQISESLFLNNTAQRPRTSIAPDEILVQVISAAINPVDYKLAETSLSRVMIKTPASPGLDYCGRVISSGNAIDSITNGQLVFGRLDAPTQFGTLGEYIIVTLQGCLPLPAGLDVDQAAAIGTAGITAYQTIAPYVSKGSRVFINGGSGGTGVFGVQIAKILGCFVTTSCSTKNIQFCKDLGADEVIDYKVSDIAEKLKAEGLVYDLVVDNVGTPEELYTASNQFLKESGLFIQVGATMSWGTAKSIASRALIPSFFGGGSRKFSFCQAKNDPEGYAKIGDVCHTPMLSIFELICAVDSARKAQTCDCSHI